MNATTTTTPELRAAQAVQCILSGTPLNGSRGDDFGPYAEPIHALADTLESGGVEAVRRVFPVLAGEMPALHRLACADEADLWPDPEPLPSNVPDVEPFQPLLLPEAFQGWTEDVADRMQVPLDFPAVGMMTAAAAALGRRVGIRPKRRDSWLVVPNLWGMIIGRPGFMKSPALDAVLKPLRHLQAEALEAYREDREAYDRQKQIQDAMASEIKKEVQRAVKEGRDAEDVLRRYELEEPTCRRYIVNDATVEKLGEMLKENPNGLLQFRDELAGFLDTLDKAGREGDRKFYLEAWDGTNSFTSDRIGRGTIHVPNLCLSLLGTIQPGVLQSYMEGATGGGRTDDGLVQRFQLAVWPDPSEAFENVDRYPNAAARDHAFETVRRLSSLTAEGAGADEDDDARRSIPFLRFDEAAQEAFDMWREDLERRVRSGDEPDALTSHLAKYRSLIPALALLSHLADGHAGPVGLEAMRRAEAWGHYLESHARRIYGAAAPAEEVAVRELGEHILKGDLPQPFTLRDVYQKGWSKLDTKARAQPAVQRLEQLGWLQAETEDTGGRPSTKHHVNPKLHG